MFNLRTSKAETKVESAMTPLFSAAATKETRRDAAWLAARLARSKLFHAGEMETETVEIGPALAELMLKHNDDNRPLRKRYIAECAKLMQEGRWQLHSQGISFTRDGVLNNGQHRLHAVVAAGVAVPFRVTFGEARNVFTLLDTGKNRNAADALHIAGFKYWTNLAAAAKIYAAVTSDKPWLVRAPNNEDVLELLRANTGMENVCAEGVAMALKLKCSSAPPIAAFYIIRQHSKHPDRLADFAKRLAQGNDLKAKDPVLVLRNMIVTRAFEIGLGGAAAVARSTRMTAAIILAWNRWVRGGTATDKTMRWLPAEPFPLAE